MRLFLLALSACLLPGGLVYAEDEDPIVGEWHIISIVPGREIVSKITITRGAEGLLEGAYLNSQGETATLVDVAFDAGTLTFKRPAGPRTFGFKAEVENGQLEGHHQLGPRRIPVLGTRGEEAFEAMRAARRKANIRTTDLEADYDRHARRAVLRDAFPVLFDPKLTPAAEAKDIRDDEPIIGVVLGAEAKAYPISIMGRHELVNDTCGGQPIAASW